MDRIIRGAPVVCAVRESYLICVPLRRKSLVRVTVGGTDYFCHSNGIRRSAPAVQKFAVPMKELNEARAYTVTCEAVRKRTPRLCEKEPPVSFTFPFRPLEKTDGIRIFHVSDAHGAKAAAIRAGNCLGEKPDLLILNGDLASQTSTEGDLLCALDIASAITGGGIPCIISRGNHDLRGARAEELEDYLPTDQGRTCYPVSLGAVHFLVLDCGEDKEDSHREYSGTVCCHRFRLEETELLRSFAEEPLGEPAWRIVISHVPFNMDNEEECKGERPFNIERPLYSEWCRILRERYHPDFMLSGHTHTLELLRGGSERDAKRLGADTVLGGAPVKKNGRTVGVIGCTLTLTREGVSVRFTDDRGRIRGEDTVSVRPR